MLNQLNEKYKLNLTKKDINYISEMTPKDYLSIAHVPLDKMNFYKSELLIKKLFITFLNKEFSERDQLTLLSGQSSIKVNIVIAKKMDNKEIILDTLESLLRLAIGDHLPHGDFPSEVYDLFLPTY